MAIPPSPGPHWRSLFDFPSIAGMKHLNCALALGAAVLCGMLASGCYRVNVPEEGALFVVAWLLAHGDPDQARRAGPRTIPQT